MSIMSRFDAINSRSRHPPKPAGNCDCCADEAQEHQEPVAVEQTQPENRNDDHRPRRREWHEFELTRYLESAEHNVWPRL